MGSGRHILAIPYPAQGHVIPMLELSLCLAKQGFEITFLNTEYNHNRVMGALAGTERVSDGNIHLVSLPDGMKPGEDRNDLGKLTNTMMQVMPLKLEQLINTIEGLGGRGITCVIADENLGWALEVAEKMRIRRVAFWPAAAALLAMQFRIPKLIEQKLIDSDGKKSRLFIMIYCPLFIPTEIVFFAYKLSSLLVSLYSRLYTVSYGYFSLAFLYNVSFYLCFLKPSLKTEPRGSSICLLVVGDTRMNWFSSPVVGK